LKGCRHCPKRCASLTTIEEAERVRLALLSEQPGWFHGQHRDFDLGPIDFGTNHIHVLQGTDGKPLSDIRSAADNACVADQVAELIRGFNDDATIQLHTGMSGRRKALRFFTSQLIPIGKRSNRTGRTVKSAEISETIWHEMPLRRLGRCRPSPTEERAYVTE